MPISVLEAFLISNNWTVINDGSITRSDPRKDGTPSPIDITAVPRRWADLSSWKVDDCPTSDHHVITSSVETTNVKGVPKRRKWSLKRADWSTFRKELDTYLLKHSTEEVCINKENDILVTGILTAARKAVPRGRRPVEVPWWNEEVASAIELRKQAWKKHQQQKANNNNDQELQEQFTLTRRTIDDAKRNHYLDIIQNLTVHTPDGRLWKILRGMDRKRTTYTPQSPIGGGGELATQSKGHVVFKGMHQKRKDTQPKQD